MLVDVRFALIGGTLFGTAGTPRKVRSLLGIYFVMNASPCVSLPPLSLLQAKGQPRNTAINALMAARVRTNSADSRTRFHRGTKPAHSSKRTSSKNAIGR